jgi:hypothetical protein
MATHYKKLIFCGFAVIATIGAFAGCKGRSSSKSEVQNSAEAGVAKRYLTTEQAVELVRAGFKPDEVKAVSDSIEISEWLAVQSFVDDANAGQLPSNPLLRRESHGKGQGCLRADFQIFNARAFGLEGLRRYPVWIRLSNGGIYQRDDRNKHISRGWGIKLMDVAETPTHTFDFVMLSSPIFFISDITHYPGFLKSTGEGKIGLAEELLFGMNWDEKVVVARRLMQKVANLLDMPLYSAVPYRYSSPEAVAKYALAPCNVDQPPFYPPSVSPASDDPDYLELAMNQSLEGASATKPLCYFFYAQRPNLNSENGNQSDSIDNPTHEWKGKFERVARITIPAGQHRGGAWDYRKNKSECERMAFSPWNSTTEAEPIGKVNWSRRYVYSALANFRRNEFPKIYQTWLTDHDSPLIREDIRRELARLSVYPTAITPRTQDATEPSIDEGFKALNIGQ